MSDTIVDNNGFEHLADTSPMDCGGSGGTSDELTADLANEVFNRIQADQQLTQTFNLYRTAIQQDSIDNSKVNTADLPDYLLTNLAMDTSNPQDVSIIASWWYKETGQQQTFPVSLPFASVEQPGIMPKESFQQIETLNTAVQNVAKQNDVANALASANNYTDNQIEAVKNSTLHYIGEVATNDDLPADAELFDLYHVLDTGNGFYWFGNKWNQLDFEGLSIDLSDYYTGEVTDEKIAATKPGNFSSTEAGLIKGTDDVAPVSTAPDQFGLNDGKIFAENDSTAAVIGWNRIVNFAKFLYQALTDLSKFANIVSRNVSTHTHDGNESVQISYNNLTDAPIFARPLQYSATEQDTGNTWIDGRPIYQKTVNAAGFHFFNKTKQRFGKVDSYIPGATTIINSFTFPYNVLVFYITDEVIYYCSTVDLGEYNSPTCTFQYLKK